MRYYYQNTIEEFIYQSFEAIWAGLTAVGRGDLLQTQKQAWREQILILKTQLQGIKGDITLSTPFLVWASALMLFYS